MRPRARAFFLARLTRVLAHALTGAVRPQASRHPITHYSDDMSDEEYDQLSKALDELKAHFEHFSFPRLWLDMADEIKKKRNSIQMMRKRFFDVLLDFSEQKARADMLEEQNAKLEARVHELEAYVKCVVTHPDASYSDC